jgi:acetyl-CoA carboxylase carboxyltransferase component
VSWQKEIDELAEKRALAKEQGGAESVARQHAKGRLTVRERVETLLDDGSFEELGIGAGVAERDDDDNLTGFTPANYVLGFGTLDGRRCIVGGEDFTLKGGSPNEAGLRKSIYAESLACQYRVPLVRLHEGGGGSVAGAGSKMVGDPPYLPPRFRSVAEALASVPVASAALGPVAGLPASRLVASHFSVMTEESQVLVAGPAVVERALKQRATKEELGGAKVHTRNGVVDNLATDEADALAQIRRFLGYLPQNVWEVPGRAASDDPVERREEELLAIVPRNRRKLFDMRALLELVADRDSLFEMGRLYGRGQITALARLDGLPVGILANDGYHLAGAMTAEGAQKARRFIDMCDMFHLPIVSFVDEPGFMIGAAAEAAGTIRYGTATVLATASCAVPWASVIVRKSFGVAAAAHYGTDAYVLAWPSAEMGAVPAEGGVAVAFGRDIAASVNPEARREALEKEMLRRQSAAPRAESFSLHEMIDPRDTRPLLCAWAVRVAPLLPGLAGPRGFGYRP